MGRLLLGPFKLLGRGVILALVGIFVRGAWIPEGVTAVVRKVRRRQQPFSTP